MPKRIELKSQKFTRLKVIRFWEMNKHRKATWLCRCDCGNTRVVSGCDLRYGNTKSCGCMAKKDEIGNRHERLIITAKAETVNGITMWQCKCDCGNEAIVSGRNLRSGGVKSCGCWQKDQASKIASQRTGDKNPRYIDGAWCGWGTKEQKEFHESIRKRDNYTCRKCNKTQKQELRETSRCLSVHHKDGNHFHNTDENAVTLCGSCHQKLEREILIAAHDTEIQWAVYNIELAQEQTRSNDV